MLIERPPNTERLWRSTNAGHSWKRVALPAL
jgi:hypothetical protein